MAQREPVLAGDEGTMRRWRIALVSVANRAAFRNISPPLGLLYLAAYLRAHVDVEIRVWDQRTSTRAPADLVREIAGFEPDLAGLTCLTPSAHLLGPTIRALREARPGVRIVIGGPHASAYGVDALVQTGADALVIGEGEVSLASIVEASRDGAGLETIPGLVWRAADGSAVTNPGSPPAVADLDALPFPAYDLIDVRDYWRHWSFSVVPPPRRYVSLFTTRGCPYGCVFCHRLFGKKYRASSPERIVDEIESYVRRFGVDEIELVDDVFNADPKVVFRTAELIRRRGLELKVAFPNGLRADALDEDVVEALHSMGTYSSALALESGSPRIQQLIGKRLDIGRYLKGVESMERRGILTSGFVMLGFPTETEAEMRETMDVACRSALHHAWFFSVTPYPNTALHDYVRRTHPEKLVGIDYADTNFSYRPATNLSEVSDEVLLKLLRQLNARFYLDPRRIYRVLRDFPRRRSLLRYLPPLVAGLTRRSFPNWRPAS